jgi:PIN domain nuclease of toxin-antitoxin system
MIVLDTSTLIFWTIDPLKLSRAARQAIDSADRLIVSSISIWEICLKVKQSRLEIHPPIDEHIEGLAVLDRLEFEPAGVTTWVSSVNLDWSIAIPLTA